MDRREAAPEEEATSRRSGERGPQGLRCAGESQSLDGCFSDGCGDSRTSSGSYVPGRTTAETG